MQKEIILNSAKLLISKLIPALLLTLINVIYSRVLTPTEYGSYQTVWTYLNVFVIFTAFGLPKYILSTGAYLRGEFVKKLFRYFICLLIFIFLCTGIYLFVFSAHFDYVTRLVFLGLLLSQTLYLIQESYVIASHQGNKLMWSNSIYALVLFAVHLLVFYGLDYQLSLIVSGIAAVSVLRNVMLWNLTTRTVRNERNLGESPTDFFLLFWLGLNDGLQVLTKWMDKLFLLFMLPAAEFAVYYNGTFELPLIGMFLITFQNIITLYGARSVGDNFEGRINLFSSSSLAMSSVLFPVFAWMFWYATPIVTILFGSQYTESGQLFALTSLFLPMRICSYTVLLQLADKGRIILMGSIIDFILSLCLMVILYPLFDLNGLVLALVISTYFQAAFYLFKIKQVYKVSLTRLLPFRKLILRLAMVFAIVGGVNYLAGSTISVIQNLIIGSAVCLLVGLYYFKKYAGINYWKGIFNKEGFK